ncbi:uncharacterized protein C4orf54-like [Oryzias latipes]
MEAAEETLTYRDDTGLHGKLHKKGNPKARSPAAAETNRAESNYVDLDMRAGGPTTVKVTFTGEGNQLSVIKCPKPEEKKEITEEEEPSEDSLERGPGTQPVLETLTKLPDVDSGNNKEPSGCSEDLQYTDIYLNSKTDSDDALSEHCGSDAVEDESHYITTHEIQLTELDHDVDYDLGRGACWDFEDDNLVYSFVDYASFESDDTQEGTLVLEGRSQAKQVLSTLTGTVSTEQEDSDLCDSDKCISSDESVSKSLREDTGKIHLSIQTSSRGGNDPTGAFDDRTQGYAAHFGDRRHFSLVSSGARAGPLCDRGQYFIPAPGRQHLATKLRRNDINDYSSGASSSISELDDADKEVRNLTAKSFRSLACPYFDAINFSTSSESSLSEYGLNKWSAYVDWNCGNMRAKERSVIAQKSTTLEMNRTVENRRHDSRGGMEAPQTKVEALNKSTYSKQPASSTQKIHLTDPQQVQRGVTFNFRCNVESPNAHRDSKCSVKARSGCALQYRSTDSTGDTHKKAIFASSLLKNVISKKMQFEQERKMERGEICDTHPAVSPCLHIKDPDQPRDKCRCVHRQMSETGSAFTVNSLDEGGRLSSFGSTEETTDNKTSERREDDLKTAAAESQSYSFNEYKEDDPPPGKEVSSVGDAQTTGNERLDSSSMLTKLLFVPSCQLLTKDRDITGDLTQHTCDKGAVNELKKRNEGSPQGKEGKEKNSPEIKICLRSMKEDKGCTLNIAHLLTPQISSNINTLRVGDDNKSHVLTAGDKVPNFTVRDIRDTKCKFQTPIYHVRDVRKLVKSSYRFISLDKSDNKCEKVEPKVQTEPAKNGLPSTIRIKCNSVKTNIQSETSQASHRQEADRQHEKPQSDNNPLACSSGRLPTAPNKQVNLDPFESNPEVKLAKQKQDTFLCETAEKRSEAPVKQGALEKLKAAVKTMEQLYVFDRNEWKRKTQAPHPVTRSHVLSVITSEEPENAERTPQSLINTTETEKRSTNIIHVPYYNDTFKTIPQENKTFTNKSILHFGNRTSVGVNSESVPDPSRSPLQTPPAIKNSKTPTAPLSVKIEPAKHGKVEQGQSKISPSNPTVTQGCSDSENYLTIPGLGHANETKLLNRESALMEGSSGLGCAGADPLKGSETKKSPLFLEHPAASIYHRSTAVTSPQKQHQVLCFTSSALNVSPTPSAGDAAPQTQRKMLLDPTTGHYYLVDTPLQVTTKKLFDPDTGQYVEVPMPHSPVAPVTPVHLSLSPLALSPPAYTPTYMIYPGFIPSPTLATQAMMSQSPCHSEEAAGENVKNSKDAWLESAAAGAESAYYSATREAHQGPLHLPVSLGHVTARGDAARSDRKPLISITTQQGPRIVAPPSFDGKTMSFVVEHR